jgi:glycosyltransferase involved in cell wall biosynthesis
VINEAPAPDVPFGGKEFAWIANRREFNGAPEFKRIANAIESFEPDVLLCSWHVRAYQQACLRLKGRAVRVGCGDNQWRGTLKQQVGRLIAPTHLQRFYDVLFVPGERQALWARKMGFAGERIWHGLYTCDAEAFSRARTSRRPDAHAFVCAARLSQEKGIRLLLKAYGIYRERCQGAPWSLILAGDGQMREEVRNVPGVDWRGFVQPAELPAVFAEASCFVMPSVFEPWCVALHEAASAGLSLIATSACGAAVHLLQDEYNGYIASPNSADSLAVAMERMAGKSPGQIAGMGHASGELSRQFSPERFAGTVLDRGSELLPAVRRTFLPNKT